jgi:hypothetical protein
MASVTTISVDLENYYRLQKLLKLLMAECWAQTGFGPRCATRLVSCTRGGCMGWVTMSRLFGGCMGWVTMSRLFGLVYYSIYFEQKS